MFRRKTTLPARPSLPDNAAILEDIANAKDTDVVFTMHPNMSSSDSGNKFVANHSNYSLILDISEDLNNPNKSYLKVKQFSEKLAYLESHLDVLEEQKQSLKQLKESLSDDVQQIREELSRSVAAASL